MTPTLETPETIPHLEESALPSSRLAEMEARLAALEEAQEELRGELPDNRATIVVHSGSFDRVLSAFIIATGAAAVGMEVSLFFSFWGLNVLKKGRRFRGKKLLEQAFTLLTPAGSESLGLSQRNFAGFGARLIRRMMREKEIASLEDLMDTAREFQVRLIACQMSMDVLGIKKEELIDGIEVGGVAAFLGDAARSKVALFI